MMGPTGSSDSNALRRRPGDLKDTLVVEDERRQVPADANVEEPVLEGQRLQQIKSRVELSEGRRFGLIHDPLGVRCPLIGEGISIERYRRK